MRPFLVLLLSLALLCCKGEIFAASGKNDLEAYIASRAIELTNAADLDRLIETAGDRRLALLGEASHGTHEYYVWRDSISRRLIAGKGYNFIAVEGDWASVYELNRYVKDMPGSALSAREVLEGVSRWPLWMWGNEEVEGLAEWLRAYNDRLPDEQKVGLYGMDVYDEWRSKDVVLYTLRHQYPELYTRASNYLDCFSDYNGDSWAYAQAVARGARDCTAWTQALVDLIRENKAELEELGEYGYFYLKQNALVIKHAEQFYRKSVTRQDAASWNSRVQYMHLTVSRLLDLYGPDSKGIVWAHNTHIGDARFTEMHNRGQENIGQLSRQDHGEYNVLLVGFGTHEGRVKAGASWGAPMQNMRVPNARRGSLENLLKKWINKMTFSIF